MQHGLDVESIWRRGRHRRAAAPSSTLIRFGVWKRRSCIVIFSVACGVFLGSIVPWRALSEGRAYANDEL